MIVRSTVLHEIMREIRFQQKRIRKVMMLKGIQDGLVDSYKRLEVLLAILTALARGEKIEVKEVPEDERNSLCSVS